MTIDNSDTVNTVGNTTGEIITTTASFAKHDSTRASPRPTPRASLRAARATVKVQTTTKREDRLTEYNDVFKGQGGLP